MLIPLKKLILADGHISSLLNQSKTSTKPKSAKLSSRQNFPLQENIKDRNLFCSKKNIHLESKYKRNKRH